MTLPKEPFSFVSKIRFRHVRLMIICTAALLLTLGAAAGFKYFTAANPVLPIEELGALAESESAVTLYNDFLQSMKSGKITKTSYSTKSLYDLAAGTQETYVFSSYQDNKRMMTYQQRQPLVFWHYPEPGYYDGEHYYYKHGEDWFIDTFNRYQKQLQSDALGVPADEITAYRINDSMVYHRPDGGYQAYVYAEKRGDPQTTAEVVGVLDENFRFTYIDVTVTYPENAVSGRDKARNAVENAAGEQTPVIEKLIIEYEQVNELIEVVPPESLTGQEMKYLRSEYKKKRLHELNDAD